MQHLSRVHLSRANFLYSHDLSDAQLTWNKVDHCKDLEILGSENSIGIIGMCRGLSRTRSRF